MKISLNHLFTVVYILSPKNVASFMKNAPKPLWPTYRSMRALNMPEGINKEHGTLSLYFFQRRDRTREGWRGIESRGERERATDSNSIAEFATRFPLYPLHLSLPLPFRPLRISLVYPPSLSPRSLHLPSSSSPLTRTQVSNFIWWSETKQLPLDIRVKKSDKQYPRN